MSDEQTQNTAVALTNNLARNLWARLELPQDADAAGLVDTLVNTLMRPKAGEPPVPEAQIQAYLMVAAAHRLNPWLKEIHAFVDRGAIVPIVGIDGWINIINSHPQFDGMEFDYSKVDNEEAVTCIIYRKDRSRPIRATEFMKECKGSTSAWAKTPRRMLRHRATMQAGRLAFGIGGIRAPDEVEGFVEPGSGAQSVDPMTGFTTDLMPTSTKSTPPPPPPAKESTVIDVPSRVVPEKAAATPAAAPASAEPDLPWQDDPPAADKPAGTPVSAPKPKTDGTRPATDGEKANLVNRSIAAKINIGDALKECGIDDVSMQTMTADQFDTVKAWFTARR